MPLFAALLRGIAPSGTNMTNDKLRGVFEGLGFEDVASVVSSGNIVIRSNRSDAPLLQQRTEDALALELGIASRTLLRSYPGQPEPARRFMLWLEQSYGKGITTRSWLTVERIVRKMEMVAST